MQASDNWLFRLLANPYQLTSDIQRRAVEKQRRYNEKILNKETKKKGEDMATYVDLVKRIWGPCSDKEMEHLLWGCTCFPFGSVLQVARQLRQLKKHSEGNFEIACKLNELAIDEAMRKGRIQQSIEERNCNGE